MNPPPVLPPEPPGDSSSKLSESAKADRLLAQLLIVEGLLAAIWILAVCTFTGSAGLVANRAFVLFGWIYPLHFLIAAFTILLWVKRSPSPRRAILLLALPVLTLPVPFLLNRFNETGPLLDSPQKLIHTIYLSVIAMIILILCQPRRAARLLPVFVLKSSGINLLILLSSISLYLIPVAFLLINWAELQPAGSTKVDGYLLAYGLGAWVAYTMICTFPAALILGYSGLSFFQTEFTQNRRYRFAQLVTSLPLVLIGATLLVKMWLQSS